MLITKLDVVLTPFDIVAWTITDLFHLLILQPLFPPPCLASPEQTLLIHLFTHYRYLSIVHFRTGMCKAFQIPKVSTRAFHQWTWPCCLRQCCVEDGTTLTLTTAGGPLVYGAAVAVPYAAPAPAVSR